MISVFLQEVRGYNAIQTGLALTPATVGILLASGGAEGFARRRTQRWLILTGFVATVAGIGLLLALVRDDTSVLRLVPGLFTFTDEVRMTPTPAPTMNRPGQRHRPADTGSWLESTAAGQSPPDPGFSPSRDDAPVSGKSQGESTDEEGPDHEERLPADRRPRTDR
ncbi:MAG TPA: hypothetical protein VFZ32_07870 [Micromonosporaceae bacterium]